MSNLIDLLLEVDEEKVLAVPEKDFEIKRLSIITGKPFLITIKALTSAKFEQIEKTCRDNKGGIDGNKLNSLIVLDSVYIGEEKLFRNKDLKEKYKVPTPKDLVEKMLLVGEIATISKIVTDLMGFEKGVEEIKN